MAEKKEVSVGAPGTISVEALIKEAIASKASPETIERFLAMRKDLKAEWAKEQFDKSMAAFQSDCPIIKKTKSVNTKSGARAYSYAPIESIVNQVKDLIKKHGFSYTTRQELKPTGVKATVRVTHVAGHSEDSPMEVPFGNKTDIMSQSQVAAAALTFAKRYAFLNAFGILTGDEDTNAIPTTPEKEGGEVDAAKKKLDQARTLAGLQQAWNALNARQRASKEVKAYKDDLKKAFE